MPYARERYALFQPRREQKEWQSRAAKMDPQGYAVPLGAHIRRMNPRDTAVNIQRRKMLRRGATSGRLCPKALPRTESIAVLRRS